MRPLVLSLIVTLLLVSTSAGAALRLASFNIRHLGYNNDKDVAAVARIVSRFDLVAIQEVMNKAAVDTLEQALERETGAAWGTVTSDAVGRSSYREHYAIAWRVSEVGFEGGAVQYLDPGDVFAREPLSANFRDKDTGDIFTLATVHIVYGDGRSDRRPEIQVLDDYHGWLSDTFDHPVIITGDFNMPPDDASWRALKGLLEPMITRGATTLSTTDNRYANLYDNIWLDPALFDVTSRGIADFPSWLALSHAEARDRISDHAPVYVTFGEATVDTRPRSGSHVGDATARAPGRDCIDINNASPAQLDTLPQVGPARARAIIDGRPWDSADALVAIDGLGRSRVRAITDQACPKG